MERTIESLSGNLCNSVTRHGKNSVKIGQLIVRIIRVYLDIDKKRRHCAYNTADFIFRKLLSKGIYYPKVTYIVLHCPDTYHVPIFSLLSFKNDSLIKK